MNTKRFLLTGLAIVSISLGTMAQDRHDEHFVKEVPKGGKEVVYKDVHYHYSEGRFYRPQNEGFEMVEPPVGCEVYELPKGYAVKKHKGVTYYYKDNVCFKRGAKKGSYVVVKRPW